MDKFDWKARESAPKKYPMRIISGSLISNDGYSQYVPSGSSIFNGWGSGWSSHIVGPDIKSLPNQLLITFYSYTEDQFYSDRFNLPYDKILKLFQKGYFSPKDKNYITFNALIVGVAPGGVVSIWLDGIDRRIEVFFGVAKKIKNDWALINNDPDVKKEDYINMVINDALESDSAVAELKKKGVPLNLWNSYHVKRYFWEPKFIGLKLRDNWIQRVAYYNGEDGYINYPSSDKQTRKNRAVPRELHFVWMYNKDKNYRYKILFDESEIFETFEKLGSNNEPLELEIKLFFEEKQGKFAVSLKNNHETIQLKKFRLETYGAN